MSGLTAPVALVARRRLALGWRGLVLGGLLLGLGYGVCFASLAAARRTESAYDRILERADAADAAISLGRFPERSERTLRSIDGITDQRVYAGFAGRADGVDRLATSALLAPVRNRFPLDLPTLRAGRLPDPDAPDEAFVTTSAAERGSLDVGQRLHFVLVNPLATPPVPPTDVDVTIVGIGTLPIEAVTDETLVVGVVVLTRAFYDAHRDLVVYSASNVDLAPGVDARGELAAATGALGFQLQSARSQERQAVEQAVRPLVIVLVALGLLTFTATTVAAALVVQRGRARAVDDATLARLGMVRGQIRLIELALSGVVALAAVAAALAAMVVISPMAPVGPLHDLDPAQGHALDGVVAAVGSAAVVAALVCLTSVFSSVRRPRRRRAVRPAPRVSTWMGSPSAIAGFTLAWRAEDGTSRSWRGVGTTTAATALFALSAAFVASAIALTTTPARYGFDADVLALNAYGDQSTAQLAAAFGDRSDIEAATAFTAGSFLVDGRAVPGVAATTVKGDLYPTLLSGLPARTDSEIVVGQDTLDSIGAELGDIVPVQVFSASGTSGEPAGPPRDLRIVGVATFPPVSQMGTDTPRLGTGALVTRDAYRQMGGDPKNLPEFTSLRLADGVEPASVRDSRPEGFSDAAQSTTSWFTDAKPAELRQLDEAMRFLRGGLVVGYLVLLAVMVHALWTRARSNRRDVAVLRALGATRVQVDAVATWQVAPFALGAVLVGIPIGIVLGRRAFVLFAHSLAVVDTASTSVAGLAVLVGAVLVASAIGGLVAMAVARRSRAAIVLRGG